MMKVSKSAYYAWCARPRQLITEHELSLYRQAKALFKASRNSLGSRELSKKLHEAGYKISRYRTIKLMKKLKLKVKQRIAYKFTTKRKHSDKVANNLLNQNFNPLASDEIWAGCDVRSQGFIELIKWRLENDTTIREAFVSTDGDSVVRFFLSVPTQWDYRTLILEAHGSINDAYPDRYKRFIQSGNTEHTALSSDSFYTRTVLEVPLYVWMTDFLESKSIWEDVVDEYVEASQAP
ncbi:IS3 family transposase [uncultured Paraglaciecola sp.]